MSGPWGPRPRDEAGKTLFNLQNRLAEARSFIDRRLVLFVAEWGSLALATGLLGLLLVRLLSQV